MGTVMEMGWGQGWRWDGDGDEMGTGMGMDTRGCRACWFAVTKCHGWDAKCGHLLCFMVCVPMPPSLGDCRCGFAVGQTRRASPSPLLAASSSSPTSTSLPTASGSALSPPPRAMSARRWRLWCWRPPRPTALPSGSPTIVGTSGRDRRWRGLGVGVSAGRGMHVVHATCSMSGACQGGGLATGDQASGSD